MSDTDRRARGAPLDIPASIGGPDAETTRLRVEAAFHQRLRDIAVAFSRDVSSTATMDRALEAFAAEANALLGGRRTSVWLHQRRAHLLALSASSDARQAKTAARVPTNDPEAPAARGLRLDRPTLVEHERSTLLLTPLRGWRRALGTLIAEGPFTDQLDSDQLVDLSHELGRQLSTAVENVQLLEEILRQRRQLEDTFNSLIDLVVVTDSGMRVVQTNDAFAARVGLSRAELLERPLDTLVGSEMAAWIASLEHEQRSGQAAVAGDAARTRRFEDSRLRGTFAVTITSLITHPIGQVGRVLVVRDITEQSRLEHEREALRERLTQSEKLASLGQFVAGIAHEMNNPLQGVLGHLELMMETSEAAKPLRRDLRRIYQEADRAAKIVRNLLVFTGSRRMAPRRLRLKRILSRALASRSAALERAGIQIVRTEAEDLPWIAGDPLLLHQAFLNILINAEHAMQIARKGGRLEIATAWDQPAAKVITTIRDTGPGIPPEVLSRIFDPFFTTKDVGQGTGLGLAITYGIVQEHGGAIHAANAADGGAIFTIELPGIGDQGSGTKRERGQRSANRRS
jgi:two-component system, NtrC family, sensor kinase